MNFSLDAQARLWDAALAREPFAMEPPEEEVVEFLGRYGATRPIRVLDIGSGCGRHLIAGVALGRTMYGVDIATSALVASLARARAMGCCLNVTVASMDELPFPDEFFDGVIAWCSLNHSHRGMFAAALRESFRVLKPKAWCLGCVMNRSDSRYNQGVVAAPHTVIFTEGIEAGIWHYFPCDTELLNLLEENGEIELFQATEEEDPRLLMYHPRATRSAHYIFAARKYGRRQSLHPRRAERHVLAPVDSSTEGGCFRRTHQ